MPKFVSSEKLMLLGVPLLGVTTSTVAVGQPVLPEVSLKAIAASAKAESVERWLEAILLKCDKCDAAVKNEIAAAKKRSSWFAKGPRRT